jgi:hypothetical protein
MYTRSLFPELLELIRSVHPEYLNLLGTGHSKQEIKASIKNIDPIPESLILIYSSIDGIANDNYNQYMARGLITEDNLLPDYKSVPFNFIPDYDLIPLNRINEDIYLFQEIFQSCQVRYGQFMPWDWKPDMIPFLYSEPLGYRICIRTLPEDESVWLITPPLADDGYIINTSIDQFILTAIECYRQGAYYQYNEGMWKINSKLYKEIVRKIDPEIQYCEPPL